MAGKDSAVLSKCTKSDSNRGEARRLIVSRQTGRQIDNRQNCQSSDRQADEEGWPHGVVGDLIKNLKSERLLREEGRTPVF